MERIDIDRVIEMAWEDRTPFEAIEIQFGLSESETIKLMRSELKRNSFNLWRKRVNSGVSQKHLMKRSADMKRFKCSMQKILGVYFCFLQASLQYKTCSQSLAHFLRQVNGRLQ
jgi:uncharacterized protein (TIGR03643 family)